MRAERRFPRGAWLYALALAAVTSLPYLLAYLNAPAGWVYSGEPMHIEQDDYNSHLAKMWQGRRGEWDYRLLFTSEPQRGIVGLQGFYVALGALSRLTPFSLPLTYHLAKFLLTAGMTLAVWRYACFLFEKPFERWLALVFATLVSGWSMLLLAAPSAAISPIEFWLIDAFNLFGALYMPHFAAAVLLQIVVALAFEAWVREGGAGRLVSLTLALAAESIIQPYVVLLFIPLIGALAVYHVFVSKRLTLRRALWLVAPLGIHGGLALYQYAAMQGDAIWAAFVAQNATLSPPPVYYALGYLPFVIPIAAGLFVLLRGMRAGQVWAQHAAPLQRDLWVDDRWFLPLLWAAAAAALLYAPFPTQRRYLLGVQTPLAMLAAFGWQRAVAPRFRPRARTLAAVAYITLAAVGLATELLPMLAKANPVASPYAYESPDAQAAYAWLATQGSPREQAVFASYEIGMRIPAITGMRVYAGHPFETANVEIKREDIRRFFDTATDDEWREALLRQNGIAFVWYQSAQAERGGWNPASADYLEAAFASPSVMIYRVRGE